MYKPLDELTSAVCKLIEEVTAHAQIENKSAHVQIGISDAV